MQTNEVKINKPRKHLAPSPRSTLIKPQSERTTQRVGKLYAAQNGQHAQKTRQGIGVKQDDAQDTVKYTAENCNERSEGQTTSSEKERVQGKSNSNPSPLMEIVGTACA
jgi:hypothetical protein